MDDWIACRCRVSGRVQGVFYRASTRAQAQVLGVTGYARNLPDGSVEVLACGERAAVDSLAPREAAAISAALNQIVLDENRDARRDALQGLAVEVTQNVLADAFQELAVDLRRPAAPAVELKAAQA